MSVPVDDAVSGVWRNSLIYLISGWHDTDNVSNVQIYDPASDTWHQATPIPRRPVFGHTGSLAGNTIVYVDGARRSDGLFDTDSSFRPGAVRSIRGTPRKSAGALSRSIPDPRYTGQPRWRWAPT